MRYAIVSDIHANRPAWHAVLDDIAREGVDGICCLGDIVGYGPRPRAVLDSVLEHCDNIVLGNHDAVIAGKLLSSSFNVAARSAIEWTRDRLGPQWREPFAKLPLTLCGDGILLTHGDADQPQKFRYVTKPEQARASFRATKRDVLFFGHTHEPGIFTCGKTGKIINRLPPRDAVLETSKRYMINPGSVGDPRCRNDLRASYCIYDSVSRELHFRRVEFDVDEYRRDFAASGLTHKPFFLRILDAETIHDGDAAAVVADHVSGVSVAADAGSERRMRLRLAGAPAQSNWHQSQVIVAHQMAQSQRRRSTVTAWLSMLLIVAAAVGIGFLLPLGQGRGVESAVAGEDQRPVPEAHRVKVASKPAPPAPDPAKITAPTDPAPIAELSDVERILSDGFEDPNGTTSE